MAVSQAEKTEIFAHYSRGLATRFVDWFNEIDAGTLATTNISATGTLDVVGAATFVDAFAVTLDVSGASTLGTASIDGLTVTGTSSFQDDITLSASANIILDETTGTKIGTDTDQKLGFFNATPVVQRSALTAAHAALTQAGTDSGDVAIQAITSSTPFGFANAAEGEAVVACVINAMARLAQIEAALETLGLVAAN